MTSKMVANFRRSLSFPNQPTSSSSYSTKLPNKKANHVRSTSLPSRSHPLIFHLKHEINDLKSWASSSKPAADNNKQLQPSAWLCHGLSRLKNVQESLDDLLQLPQTRESLCGHNALIEKFLDHFLRFVDVYGIFQTLLLTLKERHLAAQVAVRRRDDSKLAFYFKNLRKMAKDFSQLVSSIQCMRKISPSGRSEEEEDAENFEAIKDVIEVTALVSVALFNGLSVSLTFRKSSCLGFTSLVSKNTKKLVMIEGGIQEFQDFGLECLWGLRKKGEDELKLISKRMHELEDCIGGIEISGERVFRSLINTRVSLLNVLTH